MDILSSSWPYRGQPLRGADNCASSDGNRPQRRRRSLVVGNRSKGDRIMTESSGGGGRAEVERTLVQRSMEDEDFRQRLLDDPKGAVEQELGSRLPEGVEVSAQIIYLVLPSASPLGQGGELSDQELDEVAGGDESDNPWAGC